MSTGRAMKNDKYFRAYQLIINFLFKLLQISKLPNFKYTSVLHFILHVLPKLLLKYLYCFFSRQFLYLYGICKILIKFFKYLSKDLYTYRTQICMYKDEEKSVESWLIWAWTNVKQIKPCQRLGIKQHSINTRPICTLQL